MTDEEKKKEKRARDIRSACIKHCVAKWPDDSENAAKGVRLAAAMMEARELLKYAADKLGICLVCDQPVHEVTTSFTDATAVHVLFKLVQWCSKNNRHEFKAAEVKGLLDHTQYANLNHMIRFAGIVYRPTNKKTGKPYNSTYYGIHLTRAWQFFRNEIPGPIQITSNRFTGARVASTEKLLRDFPGIGEFLNEDGEYNPDHIVADNRAIKTKPLPTVPEYQKPYDDR